MTTIEFFVPGIPVAFARTGGGKTTHRFTPAKQRAEMGAIKLFGQRAMEGRPPLDCAVLLIVLAIFPYPGSWSQKKRDANPYKISKPDCDNISKLVKDALNGVVWLDDARIAESHIVKEYGIVPGIKLTVRVL